VVGHSKDVVQWWIWLGCTDGQAVIISPANIFYLIFAERLKPIVPIQVFSGVKQLFPLKQFQCPLFLLFPSFHLRCLFPYIQREGSCYFVLLTFWPYWLTIIGWPNHVSSFLSSDGIHSLADILLRLPWLLLRCQDNECPKSGQAPSVSSVG